MTTREIKAKAKAKADSSVQAFSFGEDVSVIDGRGLWEYFDGAWICGNWYEPPISFRGLARAYRMAPHHQSAIDLKVQMLTRHFEPSRWLSAAEHERGCLDYLQMGNLFLEMIPNFARRPLRYRVSPSLYTRVGVEEDTYHWVKPDPTGFGSTKGEHEFEPGAIVHLLKPDVEQEIYGLPGWLSSLNSGLLNESATLFRRRYYKNGGHAGYIFYATDAGISEEDFEAIKTQMRGASGQGNFKNLFVHSPQSAGSAQAKEKGIQIIPLAEVAAKDEFLGIKNVSRDDMLTAHRVPPQLLGIVPTNNGGFGDIRTANDVFFVNEIEPVERAMERLNDLTGLPIVNYRPYQPLGQGGGE